MFSTLVHMIVRWFAEAAVTGDLRSPSLVGPFPPPGVSVRQVLSDESSGKAWRKTSPSPVAFTICNLVFAGQTKTPEESKSTVNPTEVTTFYCGAFLLQKNL